MAKSIQEILAYQNLTALAKTTQNSVMDVLPSGFTSNTVNVEGASGHYLRVSGNRKTARIAAYGSEPQIRELEGVEDVDFRLLHTIEEQMHDISTLMALTNMDNPQVQEMGMAEVARQTAFFAKYAANLRISAIYSVLSQGSISWDSSGNLLPNDSGAANTVDFQVPANNKNQLNGIIGASWASAGTDITAHIIALRKQATRQTGYPLKYAFYGEDVFQYLLDNTTLSNLVAAGNPLANVFAQNLEIPSPFLGLTWVPMVDAPFFEDNDGTDQSWWSGDTVVFTPEPSAEWWEIAEGSFPTPTGFSVTGDAPSNLSANFSKVYGAGSYAITQWKKPGLSQIHFDTFLPLLKVPGAIFIADVVA